MQQRFKIGDIDELPLFIKPKELKKILPVSEPVLYEIINRPGCPRIPIGHSGKACVIDTRKFIEWFGHQAVNA